MASILSFLVRIVWLCVCERVQSKVGRSARQILSGLEGRREYKGQILKERMWRAWGGLCDGEKEESADKLVRCWVFFPCVFFFFTRAVTVICIIPVMNVVVMIITTPFAYFLICWKCAKLIKIHCAAVLLSWVPARAGSVVQHMLALCLYIDRTFL